MTKLFDKKNNPGQPVAAVTRYILVDKNDFGDLIKVSGEVFDDWCSLANSCIENAENDGININEWMEDQLIFELGPSVKFIAETKMTLERK